MKHLLLLFVHIMFLNIDVFAGNSAKLKNAIRLDACPTMQLHYLQKLQDTTGIEILSFDNTSEVLTELTENKIDVAFVGRPASNLEKKDTLNEYRLRSGYMLTGSFRQFVTEDELNKFTIKKSLDTALATCYHSWCNKGDSIYRYQRCFIRFKAK